MPKRKWLIDEWRDSWRMASVIVATIGAAASTVWIALPADTQTAILTYLHVPPGAIPLALFVGVVIARLFNQPMLHPNVESEGETRPPEAS